MLGGARRYFDELGAGRAVFCGEGMLAAEAPAEEEVGVKSDAEEISGDESELSGPHADDADNGTVDGGDHPTLPKLLAQQNGAKDSQYARKIVEPKEVQKIQHAGTRVFP
jgi:hypothetical protein